ncbi:MAG: 50S ribosomal protein L25 [Planctomycetota bacterium]|nr:50S ribosomal protein L25 [Planctomycetota bacterium]
MATTTLNVAARQCVGKQEMKRLRLTGRVPANLYGHGEPNINLSVCADEVNAAIRHGAHLVELKGAVNESALIKSVQWDMMGSFVLHLDLTRAQASELVESSVNVELKGEAPGVRQGGIVEQPVHTIRFRCPAGLIPDKLVLSVKALELGGSLTAADIRLPAGALLLSDPAEVVVHCIAVKDDDETGLPPGEGNEPEIIGRRRSEDGEEINEKE